MPSSWIAGSPFLKMSKSSWEIGKSSLNEWLVQLVAVVAKSNPAPKLASPSTAKRYTARKWLLLYNDDVTRIAFKTKPRLQNKWYRRGWILTSPTSWEDGENKNHDQGRKMAKIRIGGWKMVKIKTMIGVERWSKSGSGSKQQHSDLGISDEALQPQLLRRRRCKVGLKGILRPFAGQKNNDVVKMESNEWVQNRPKE